MKLPKRSLFRMRLSEAQNHRCCYCGCDMDVSHLFKRTHARDLPLNAMTVEHVIPLSQGGPDAWGNKVAACWECNSLRGDTSLYLSVPRSDLVRPAPWASAKELAGVILARRVGRERQRAEQRAAE